MKLIGIILTALVAALIVGLLLQSDDSDKKRSTTSNQAADQPKGSSKYAKSGDPTAYVTFNGDETAWLDLVQLCDASHVCRDAPPAQGCSSGKMTTITAGKDRKMVVAINGNITKAAVSFTASSAPQRIVYPPGFIGPKQPQLIGPPAPGNDQPAKPQRPDDLSVDTDAGTVTFTAPAYAALMQVGIQPARGGDASFMVCYQPRS